MEPEISNDGVDRVELTRIMLNIFSKQSEGIQIAHLNCCSVLARGKIDQLRLILAGCPIDVFCITETWLNSSIPDSLVSISGYKLIRHDRHERFWGVAMYIKSSLRIRLVEKATVNRSEYIATEISGVSDKILIITVYNPHRENNLAGFFDVISRLTSMYRHVLVTGDLNVNLLITDKTSLNFCHLVDSVGLHIVNAESPTHFSPTASSPSLLDLFLVDSKENIPLFHQLAMPGFSHHDLIFCTYNLNLNAPRETRSFSYKDYNRINISDLQSDAITIPWDSIYTTSNVADQLEFLSSRIKHLFDRHVPTRTCTATSQPPWFSNHLKDLMAERDHLYRIWRRSRSTHNWECYRRSRNHVTCSIRWAKMNFYKAKFDTNLPARILWNNLREVGIGNSNAPICELDTNVLNDYFLSAHTDRLSVTSVTQLTASSLDSSASFDGFSFQPVSEGDVCRAIYSIKSNAVGSDGISGRFIKLILPIFLPFLTYFLNTCITTSVFPPQWKSALVIPIPKHRDAIVPSDYRPISLLPFLSKVFEKLLMWQIMEYAAGQNLLIPWQSGFRPGHSCATALLKISDDIRVNIDNNLATLVALLDFTKAFDMVDHCLLCEKLYKLFSFSSTATRLIRSFLSSRQQAVLINNVRSEYRVISCGVPQGSVLAPLLFSLFINDLPSVLKHSKVLLYADDVQVYLARPPLLLDDGIYHLNDDLQAVSHWAINNNLLLNPVKSQSIVVYKNKIDTLSLSPVQLNNTTIPFTDRVVNLGLVMNSTFTWDHHITNVVGKIYGGLRALWLTASLMPLETRRKLIQSLLVPLITYCHVVYCKLDSQNARKLQVAFNACTRYVHLLRKHDHISQYKDSILGCSLDNYLKYRCVLFLYNLIRSRQPSYLFEKLTFGQSNRSNCLLATTYKTALSKSSFFVHTVHLWNSLPLRIRRVVNMSTFKRELFAFFKDK